MAEKFYGDRPRSSYLDLARQEEQRIAEYTRRADRDFNRRRMMGGGEYDELYPGLTDEDAAAVQRDAALGTLEVPMTIGSSILADIPAGWAGINALGPEKTRIKETGEDVLAEQQLDPVTEIERYQEALTYMPRSESGKRALESIGNALQTILSPATRATDAIIQTGMENDIPIPGIAIPLTAVTALAEAVPGRRPASATARAAERTSGRFVKMAEETADNLNVDELGEMAQIAAQRDPNVTMGAQAAEGGAPMPEANPALAGQNLPELDRPASTEGLFPEEIPETGEMFDWNAGNARPRGGEPTDLNQVRGERAQQKKETMNEIRMRATEELQDMQTAARLKDVTPEYNVGDRFVSPGPATVGGNRMQGEVGLEIKKVDSVSDDGTVRYLVEQTFPDGSKGEVRLTAENLKHVEKKTGPKAGLTRAGKGERGAVGDPQAVEKRVIQQAEAEFKRRSGGFNSGVGVRNNPETGRLEFEDDLMNEQIREFGINQGYDPDAYLHSTALFESKIDTMKANRSGGNFAGRWGKQRGAVENTGAGQQVLATQAGRNVATNTAEMVRGQPAPQDLPPVNVKTPGAKVGTMERRVGTTGAYRGAPRDVSSPQKLGAMRNRLITSLERGAPGRAWYDRSSEAALELTGDRPNLRDRYVGSIAVTSADTAVPSNAGFAIKGYNQLNAGDPVHTGRYPQRMSKDIETIASGEEKMLSDKVGPFYEANKISDLGKDVRPTNDLWMARAFGYTQKDPKTGKFVEWSSGLGEAQHRFMDEEINRLVDIANERKLGGHDDWTPERVQAAIWVDTKARREGTSIERAATDFATDLDARSINITSETTPANSLNHMPGVYGDEARGQLAFEQQNRIMTDEKGRNILSTGANALTRPQTTGVGVYEGASNPVAVNRILGSTETGVPTMDPSSRKIAETIASTEGLLKGQESVGYNFLRPPKKVGDANAAVVPKVDDVKGLQGQLDEAFGGSVIATPSEEGIRILKVDGEPFDAKQRKALQGIIGEKPDWKINSGDLVGGFGDYKPSNYLNTIDEYVADTMDVNTRWAAKALEDLDTTLAKEFPDAGPRNEILQKTRQALSEGGIARVRELVKQGVLPAIVIGVLAGGQAGSPESQRQQT